MKVLLYPAMLKISGALVVIVGGGKVALRKILRLLESEADLVVIAPDFIQEIKDLAQQHKIKIIEAAFSEKLVGNPKFIFGCTDDQDVNRSVYEFALKRNIFVNLADQPELSTFFVPSSISRGKLNISISTTGASPLVSKRLRKYLETIFTEDWELFLESIAEKRFAILRSSIAKDEKSAKLKRLGEKSLIDMVLSNRLETAISKLEEIVRS